MRNEAAIARLQRIFEDMVGKLGAVGVLAAIDIPGEQRVHVAAGLKDANSRVPLGPENLYQIGSQAKTLLALAAVLLARDGVFGLDDPVVKFVDVPIDPRITIRHLLMNTSGLVDYATIAKNIPSIIIGPNTPRALIDLALPQSQLFEPGLRFDYTNTGWVVVAMLLDAVHAGGYADFIRKRIFEPLGMANSYMGAVEAFPREEMASAYLRTSAFQEPTDVGRDMDLSWTYGAGDAISTCGDMIALYRALLSEKKPIGVGLADLTADMAYPSDRPFFPLSLGVEYALGIERRRWGGRTVWGHPGKTIAYYSSTWADEGSGIVVTTAHMALHDVTEPEALSAIRYNAPQLFAAVLLTAYQIAGL